MSTLSKLIAQTDAEKIFGKVEAPPGVAEYDEAAGGLGLINFLSNIIRLVTIVGGVFVLVNVIYAGWIYISSSGNVDAHKKAVETITTSIIGLVIIIASYAIAALIGVVFFGDAMFILSPTICGPEGC